MWIEQKVIRMAKVLIGYVVGFVAVVTYLIATQTLSYVNK